MFLQNPRALTSSNRFDAAARNTNYVNASLFNNLLCPACRKMHLYIHFMQKHTISSAPFYKPFTAANQAAFTGTLPPAIPPHYSLLPSYMSAVSHGLCWTPCMQRYQLFSCLLSVHLCG